MIETEVMDNIIELKHLTRKFGDLIAVSDLSLEIKRKEIFGLLGPNGAGKTTTISMICGMLEPTEGSISFKGFGGKEPKSLIGYCPQENIFYPKLTCMEQLVFMGQMFGVNKITCLERAGQLLTLLGLSDKAEEMAVNLSGGMKRRLNICLALIHDPEILVLDEPEAGLDPQSRILVRDFIRRFGESKTVILTTHNMDEADRMAHRIAIIDYGKLLLLDTPHNLKRTIGEGDMLEIVPENSSGNDVTGFIDQVSALVPQINNNPHTLLFRHPDMLEIMPSIKRIADEMGFKIAEFKLRQNTLEDVFIHLTGRNLRP
ncbi:MAG: ABC transporter ATP-binding protein [Bacteroidales bacterium]|nr:ABC transporter ATP-binding protein [Bacteroidales bacterium]